MTSTPDVDLSALAAATNQLVASIDAVDDDQWGLATPCPGWDLTALVDHVTGGNWFSLRVLAGDTADEAMGHAVTRFGDGSATQQEAIGSLHDQRRAFERPGVLDRTWQHVAGSLSGRQMIRLRIHDLVAHAWDIGETVQPPARLPEQLIRWGLDELDDADSLTAQHFGVEGLPEHPSTDDPQAAYLQAVGRRSQADER